MSPLVFIRCYVYAHFLKLSTHSSSSVLLVPLVLFCICGLHACVCSVAQSCWTLCDHGGSVVKDLPATQETQVWRCGFHPWVWTGRSPGGGTGNPLQCFCPENPMDRGAWWATVLRVSKNLTLSN